jgi:hypothetical protein
MPSLTNNAKAQAGNGLNGKTHILTVDLNDSGNHTQATIDGFVQGIAAGNSLANANTKSDAFTVVGIKGAVGESAITVAVQGTGTPSTTAEEYFANVDVTAVITLDNV